MYASLSLKRLSSALAISFTIALLIVVTLRGMPSGLSGWGRPVSTALTWWSVTLVILFGWSGKLAPWRMIWWCIPPLNKLVFPDLNGKWQGKLQSNWSVFQEMLSAATARNKKLEEKDLPDIPLKPVDIELMITASLFTFRIEAKVSGVDGTSHSISERIQKDEKRDRFELFYVYVQETPQPSATDEASHPGSARLDVDTSAWALKGEYWNRRKWRSGFNAAGLMEVTRKDRGGWF
nr:hypothetical protein [uncultured Sphingomonas sp.]